MDEMWVIVGCGDDVEDAYALGPYASKAEAEAEMVKFHLTPHDADTAWMAVRVQAPKPFFYDEFLDVQRWER